MAGSRQCVILVGGKGSRLGELVQEVPKPLLEVDGLPFVNYLIQEVSRYGFRRIVLLAGFKAEVFSSSLQSLQSMAPRLSTVDVISEPAPMGTGGALKFAAGHLDQQFLLMNGDSLFDFNLLDFISPSISSGVVGRVALKEQLDVSRYGTVELVGDRIQSFVEKKQSDQSGIINGGIYWFDRSVLDHIGDGFVSLETDVLPKLASSGLLSGRVYDGFMLDIGLPETLERAQTSIPQHTRRPAVFLHEDVIFHGRAELSEPLGLIDGAAEAIKACNDSGYFIFLVGKSLTSVLPARPELETEDIEAWFDQLLAPLGAHIDAIMNYKSCPGEELIDGVADNSVGDSSEILGAIEPVLENWPVVRERSILVSRSSEYVKVLASAGLTGRQFEEGDLHNFLKSVSSVR